MRSRIFFIYLLLYANFAIAEITPANDIPDMELRYQVHLGGDAVGFVTTKVQQEGSQYTATSETQADGLAKVFGESITEKVWFNLEDGHYRPLRYYEKRTGSKSHEKNVAIDWDKNQIRFDSGDVIPIPANSMLEAGSIPLIFMLTPHDEIKGQTLNVITHRSIRPFSIFGVNPEVLETGIEKFNTVQVEAQRTDKENRTLTVWMATDKDNIPVKIETRRKGKVSTLTLVEFKILPKAAAHFKHEIGDLDLVN